MKDLFILISAVMLVFNIGLMTHKVVDYYKITKEIAFPYPALEALRFELRHFCIGKLQATMLWGSLLAVLLFIF